MSDPVMRGGSGISAGRDANRVPTLLGVSTSDGITPVALELTPSGALPPALVSTPLTGQAIIASTGTAVRLNGGTSQALTNGIIISAVSGNNANGVTIGGSSVTNTVNGTGNGYILAPGASVSFAVNNTNVVYINGTTGDIISWAAS